MLHQADVRRLALRIFHSRLEPAGDAPAVDDRPVRMRRHSRVILEGKPRETVAPNLLQVAVEKMSRAACVEDGLEAPWTAMSLWIASVDRLGGDSFRQLRHDIGLVDDGQPLGQVGVVREVAVAIADREDGGYQLDPGPGCRRLHLLDVSEVEVRDAIQNLELVVGDEHRRVTVLLRPIDQGDHVLDRLVDLQVGAAIDPPLGVARGPGLAALR